MILRLSPEEVKKAVCYYLNLHRDSPVNQEWVVSKSMAEPVVEVNGLAEPEFKGFDVDLHPQGDPDE